MAHAVLKPGHWPGFLLLATALALGACDRTPSAAASAAIEPAGKLSYVEWLDAYHQALDAPTGPKTPATAEERLRLLLERARLSGDYEDYARAGDLIRQTQESGALPPIACIAVAGWHFTLHRLAAADEVLTHCAVPPPADQSSAFRADLDFYRGRYTEAEQAYREALNRSDDTPALVRMAQLRNKTGAAGEAMALLTTAEQRYHGDSGVTRAWMRLQRGLIALDQGRYDQALALYLGAAEMLPGWWLVDEHIAEVRALRGEADVARTRYRDIVQRTGHPEFMVALARLESAAGDADAARRLRVEAERIYRERMLQFPEAAAGHALEYFLAFGDSAEAVALAQANVRNRPYGDAQIQLARAYLKSGRVRDAQEVIATVLDTAWNTAELHKVAAQVYAASGDAGAAQKQRQLALDLNPHAEQQYP